jgi:hypothetical protein
MRRTLTARRWRFVRTAAVLFPVLLLVTLADTADARGLYKGHGRRSGSLSTAVPWSGRVNLSGGFHGASDGLRDDGYYAYAGPYGLGGGWYDYDFWRLGGYAQVGLEVALQNGFSLEPYGLYRKVDDTDRYLVSAGGGSYAPVADHVDIEAWGLGMTVRRYITPGSNAAYWGVGGGYVHSESHRTQHEYDAQTFALDDEDEAPEAHFLVGFEARAMPSLAFGVELGYRYAWLDDVSDFSGVILGARVGILMP